MGELFQKKLPKVATPLSKVQQPPEQTQSLPDSAETVADIARALGRVTIVHGAQELPFDVAGKTIAYVRAALGPILQVPRDAEAWIGNKHITDESTVLLHNSQLEFIKASGTKGAKMTTTKDFATHSHSRLAITKSGESLFFSPFSIQVALAMCGRGAKGETRKVMADLIGFDSYNNEEQDAFYAKLIKSVNGDGSERLFQLVTANALWGQEGYKFHADYQKAIADYYDGAFNVVNYRTDPDKAANTINAWVEDKTKEKIKELVKSDFINDATRLILTNAIYFKGKWAVEFEVEQTKLENFLLLGSGTTQVQTMHKQDKYPYYEGAGYKAIDLPYKGDQLSMLVVLPTFFDGLAPIETKWHEEGLYAHVTANLRREDVVLSLPRFKMETEFKLKQLLCDMGAELAFSDNADFSGISEEALKISEVVHKAFVEVNEEGTEAAAATAIGMMKCTSAVFAPPKVFKADHPFLFFIRDKVTNMILFSGHVVHPK